jgi:hypothetical protein
MVKFSNSSANFCHGIISCKEEMILKKKSNLPHLIMVDRRFFVYNTATQSLAHNGLPLTNHNFRRI